MKKLQNSKHLREISSLFGSEDATQAQIAIDLLSTIFRTEYRLGI